MIINRKNRKKIKLSSIQLTSVFILYIFVFSFIIIYFLNVILDARISTVFLKIIIILPVVSSIISIIDNFKNEKNMETDIIIYISLTFVFIIAIIIIGMIAFISAVQNQL